jgi:hypothetical protein
MNKPINWIKARCPVCTRIYEYAEGEYTPKTCADFECVRKYNRHPERYQSLNEQLDKCRGKVKI